MTLESKLAELRKLAVAAMENPNSFFSDPHLEEILPAYNIKDGQFVLAANPETVLTLCDVVEIYKTCIEQVIADEETGKWGPDITMKCVMQRALKEAETRLKP